MRRLAVVFIFIVAGHAATRGQEPPARAALDVSAGAVQFDLSGTGVDLGFAVRRTNAITNVLGINLGLLVAFPNEDPGRSTLIVPEAHLHYHWRVGPVRPFAGGGIGTAIRTGNGDTRANLSLAGAVGARVELQGGVAVLGEFRLRGIERDFAGTTAEWMGGISWFLD